MKTFTKWVVINSIVATLAVFAAFKGFFSFVINNDASYLSIVMFMLFAGFSIFMGKLSIAVDQKKLNDHDLDIGWFASDQFLSLGLLGTVIGFCYMVSSSLVETKELSAIIGELKAGAATAVLTTIVGLVCSMLLQLQLFIIQHTKKNERV